MWKIIHSCLEILLMKSKQEKEVIIKLNKNYNQMIKR